MTSVRTSQAVRGLQIGMTLLALWGFYVGFRMFQGMMAPPPPMEANSGFERTPFDLGTPSRPTKTPLNLPWPNYPGAKQTYYGDTETYEGRTVIQTVEASANPEKILNWYRKKLSHKGWSTQVSDKNTAQGKLAASADTMMKNPEVFQQEDVLRMIDTFQTSVLIMRKREQILFVTIEPSQNPRRQDVRVVWYDMDKKPEPNRSTYAKQHMAASLPFNQEFGDDDLTSTTIASPLSPETHLAQWRTRLVGEGWQEQFDSKVLNQFSRMPGTCASFFTRGDNGTIVAIQPGPDHGSVGLVTRIQ